MLSPQAMHNRAGVDLYQGLRAIQVASCTCAWELFLRWHEVSVELAYFFKPLDFKVLRIVQQPGATTLRAFACWMGNFLKPTL